MVVVNDMEGRNWRGQHTIIRHNGVIFFQLARLFGERDDGFQRGWQRSGHLRSVEAEVDVVLHCLLPRATT